MLNKKGCWILRYIDLQKKLKIYLINVRGIIMFEVNLTNDQKSVFLGLLNGLILADGVISPKETEKWNFFASLFQGITYKSVPLDELNDVFPTKKSKSSVLLELISVALSKENLDPKDKEFIGKVGFAMNVDKDVQDQMWLWVEKILELTKESEKFMN
jgi:hypothetical protein